MYTLMSNTSQVRISLFLYTQPPLQKFHSSPMDCVCEKDLLAGSRRHIVDIQATKVLAETLRETALEAIEIFV